VFAAQGKPSTAVAVLGLALDVVELANKRERVVRADAV